MLALLLVIAAIVPAGCQREPKAQKTSMELTSVPEEIIKVAKEKLPGVKFDSAYKEPNGSYELRGKDRNGKVREIDIRPDGTVEEIQ